MKRALVGCVLVLGLYGLARADTVSLLDPAKKYGRDVDGQIESESPAGIKIKEAKGPPRVILAAEVQSVLYEVPGVAKKDFNLPAQRETDAQHEKDAKKKRALLDEALGGFKELEAKADKANHVRAKRYAAFRVARCKAYLAAEDPSQRPAAVKELLAYRKAYPDGWEIIPVLRQLSQMQEEDGDLAGAAETPEQMRGLKEVPDDVKQTTTVLVAQMFMRAKKYDQAEERLKQALADSKLEASLRPKLQVYLVKAKA